MFEGSESVEVEGGSTESTTASSISACKKVKTNKKETELCLRCSCWDLLLVFFSVCVPVHHICLPFVCLSVCVFPAVQEIFISSSGVLVTPRGRGCAIRGTAGPSGQPSKFIISQCQRDRRGNGTDQWAVRWRLD